MSNSPTAITQQKIITSFVVLVVIAALIVGVDASKTKDTAPSPTTSTTASTTGSSGAATTSGTYKDGTYMADGSYGSPGGTQNVSVSITIAGNKVTDSTVIGKADGGVAQYYQSSFIKDFKQYVVGKSLDNIKVSRVSGSSLTSKGFNVALKKIKDQAQS